MKDMVKDMDRIDSEMHDLKMSYERIKAGLPVPLRAMV